MRYNKILPATLLFAITLSLVGCAGEYNDAYAPSGVVESEGIAPVSSPAPSSGPKEEAEASSSINLLQTLTIKGRAPKTGYSRTEFGTAWKDVDHNGCDTRDDILARDLTDITYKVSKSDCVIQSGTLHDPYTNTEVNFNRGVGSSLAVQVDHVQPLSLAWQMGAWQWTKEKREQFANDPLNLIATSQFPNAQKSDSGPASWLPSNKSFRCQYITRFVEVAAKYDLALNQPDYDASFSILRSCS